MTLPLYSFEHEFQGYISERYALKLERDGIANLVRHNKGAINRAIIHRRPGDPKPTTLRDHTCGTPGFVPNGHSRQPA